MPYQGNSGAIEAAPLNGGYISLAATTADGVRISFRMHVDEAQRFIDGLLEIVEVSRSRQVRVLSDAAVVGVPHRSGARGPITAVVAETNEKATQLARHLGLDPQWAYGARSHRSMDGLRAGRVLIAADTLIPDDMARVIRNLVGGRIFHVRPIDAADAYTDGGRQ